MSASADLPNYQPAYERTRELLIEETRRTDRLIKLVRRAAPFVNAVLVLAEDKTPGLAWLADAEAELPAQILCDPADDAVPEDVWDRLHDLPDEDLDG